MTSLKNKNQNFKREKYNISGSAPLNNSFLTKN